MKIYADMLIEAIQKLPKSPGFGVYKVFIPNYENVSVTSENVVPLKAKVCGIELTFEYDNLESKWYLKL